MQTARCSFAWAVRTCGTGVWWLFLIVSKVASFKCRLVRSLLEVTGRPGGVHAVNVVWKHHTYVNMLEFLKHRQIFGRWEQQCVVRRH